jgi:ribonuclease HI
LNILISNGSSTDGSFQPSVTTSTSSPILGAAWIIPGTDHHPDYHGKIATINWPSSTSAELLAIWTGLLVMPPQAKIDLFTDSQAAIDSINDSLKNSFSPRRWLKANNDSIISNIRHRILSLCLTVKLHKIKGHSGNEYNEKANMLAKQAVHDAKNDSSLILNINDIQ